MRIEECSKREARTLSALLVKGYKNLREQDRTKYVTEVYEEARRALKEKS